MSRGRLTGQPFDPEDTGPIYQAVANVDDRGRVKLPAGIVEGVTWLRGHDTLAVLAVPGLVRLHPWAIDGEAVLRRRRELSKRAKSEPATFEILRALEDRYKRFRIPPSVRPTLTNEMILHLGLLPSAPAQIYVWRIADTIELNSAAHRAEGLAVEWEELSDLP